MSDDIREIIDGQTSKNPTGITGVAIFEIRVAVDSEEVLKKYLSEKIRSAQPLKVAPVNMGVLLKIFLFPHWRKFYRKLDLVYPDSWLSCRCLLRYNPHFQGETRIYSHRLLLDIIDYTFKVQRPLTFVGLDENQKESLQRKFKFLFSQKGDVCFLHPEMTKYQPEATLTWLNRANYGLVIAQSRRKLRRLLMDQLQQGLLFFDNGEMNRYRKTWKKKPPWHSLSGLGILFAKLGKAFFSIFKAIVGWISFYYPLKIFFSLSFWSISFIIMKTQKKTTFIIE